MYIYIIKRIVLLLICCLAPITGTWYLPDSTGSLYVSFHEYQVPGTRYQGVPVSDTDTRSLGVHGTWYQVPGSLETGMYR